LNSTYLFCFFNFQGWKSGDLIFIVSFANKYCLYYSWELHNSTYHLGCLINEQFTTILRVSYFFSKQFLYEYALTSWWISRIRKSKKPDSLLQVMQPGYYSSHLYGNYLTLKGAIKSHTQRIALIPDTEVQSWCRLLCRYLRQLDLCGKLKQLQPESILFLLGRLQRIYSQKSGELCEYLRRWS